MWNRISAEYERRHARGLSREGAMAWGLWRLPERELGLLGPVRGQRTLELGCGAARWSIALAARGARAVGIDLSESQLGHARRERLRSGARVELVHGSAETLPFADGRFDVAFCDWGALTFADPRRIIPEVARVLRPGGRLVFSAASPLRLVSWNARSDRQSRRLERPYFGPERLRVGDTYEFSLTYGAWLDLFVRNGLRVESLRETRPPPGRRSSYLSRPDDAWARRWPTECLWRLRKADSAGAVRTARRSARTSSR